MEPRQIRIVDGKAGFSGRSIQKKTSHGALIGGIASKSFNSYCLNLFYDNIYDHAPMNQLGDHTLWKDAALSLQIYLWYLINDTMAQGYSPFHHTNVANQVSDTCTVGDHLEREMGIPIGDEYVWFDTTLPIALTGDGGPVNNVVKDVTHLVLMFLQILALGITISQSIYCGVCVLISTLSESSSNLTPIIQQVGNSIAKNGCIAIKCEVENVWVCFNYQRVNVADWKFTFTHLNLSVGVTAKYALIELCWWRNGEPCGVADYMYYECLMVEYIDPWLVPSYDECRDSEWNGLALTTGEVMQQWGHEVEQLVNEKKYADGLNGNLHKWNDTKYDRDERVRIAQNDNNTGVIRDIGNNVGPALVDVAHGFWSFIG